MTVFIHRNYGKSKVREIEKYQLDFFYDQRGDRLGRMHSKIKRGVRTSPSGSSKEH